MDLLPNKQNFDLDSLNKISNIPKFRCEML
jgi:hypothetical protein